MNPLPLRCIKKASLLCLVLLTGVFIPFKSFAQDINVKDVYQDGDGFFQEEDYKEAIHYFVRVEQNNFITPNLQYKIGICYLHIPGEEVKAIPYLEEASKHISLKYKPKGIEEKQAPLHSLFFLGNAYRIDNRLSQALEVYKKFTHHKGYDGTYNPDIVETEIQACERAKEIQDGAIEVTWKNLGIPVNSPSSETNQVISGDGTVLAYLTSLKFYNAVYLSRKQGDVWLDPENITSQILSDGDFYPTALSFDGKELYLVKKMLKNADIYVSTFEEGKWSPAKPLNKNINTPSDETSATITKDGKTLYFTSNHSGIRGSFDIYRSVRGADNQWGKAESLGKVINTKEDEITPSISADGKTLYFSSKGHYNMGGFDIFYSVLQKDGKWSTPANIGYPLNTTNDNVGFQTAGDGTIGYISRIAPDGLGKEDIYLVKISGKFIRKDVPAGN
jgi:hypothetical protein